MKDYKATRLSPVQITDSRDHIIDIRSIEVADESDCFYEVKSYQKSLKEASMHNRFTEAFELGLTEISEALHRKGGTKRLDKVWERIGRLKQKYTAVNALYEIEVESDKDGKSDAHCPLAPGKTDPLFQNKFTPLRQNKNVPYWNVNQQGTFM